MATDNDNDDVCEHGNNRNEGCMSCALIKLWDHAMETKRRGEDDDSE